MMLDIITIFITCFFMFLLFDFLIYKLLLRKKVIWKNRITDFQSILGDIILVIFIVKNINLNEHIILFFILIIASTYIGGKLNYIVWGDNRQSYNNYY